MIRETHIRLPDDFGERYKKYRELALGANAEKTSEPEYLSYDKGSAIVSFGARTAQIPLATNQSVLCEALFDLPFGEWLKDIDVRDRFYTSKERNFYDAYRAVNVGIRDSLSIEDLLEYNASRVRINPAKASHLHSR